MGRVDKQNIIRLWDESAILYHQYALKYPLYRKTSEKLVQLANLNRKEEVIELGCGTGITTKMIAEKVKKVIAIDQSKKAIEIAKKYVNKPNVTFICDDIFNVSGIKAKKVLSNICVSPVFSEKSNRIKNFLKKGGEIYFSLPNQFFKRRRKKLWVDEVRRYLKEFGYEMPRRGDAILTLPLIEEKLGLKIEKIAELKIRRTKEDLIEFFKIPVFRRHSFGNIPEEIISKAFKKTKIKTFTSTIYFFRGRR